MGGVTGFEGVDGVLAVVAVIIVAALVVVPLLLLGVELVIVVVVAAASIVGRLVLGRPWVVTAERISGTKVSMAWEVAGWRRSGRVIDDVAVALAAGRDPAPQGAVRRGARTQPAA